MMLNLRQLCAAALLAALLIGCGGETRSAVLTRTVGADGRASPTTFVVGGDDLALFSDDAQACELVLQNPNRSRYIFSSPEAVDALFEGAPIQHDRRQFVRVELEGCDEPVVADTYDAQFTVEQVLVVDTTVATRFQNMHCE